MEAEKYPWYDDRRANHYVNPWADDDLPPDDPICDEEQETPAPNTPKEIYDQLSRHILRQEEAKKAAAMIVYNHLRGRPEHAFFIGPSGSGKTAIWRAMQTIFPEIIEICDGSRLTTEGFKGDYKVADLLKNQTIMHRNGNAILVVDEADKAFAPRITSGNESVGQQIAAELLKMLDGITIPITSNKTTYYVDTRRLSIVFCGAYSMAAHEIADKKNWKKIGFGDLEQNAKAYDTEITAEDLIAHGVLPELLGRVSRIVNLQPMTEADFLDLLCSECSPATRLEQQYGVTISLLPETRQMLAETAAQSGLGVRAVESMLRKRLDDALFEDCEKSSFEF